MGYQDGMMIHHSELIGIYDMADQNVEQFYLPHGGINTYINPIDPNNDGVLIHAVNVASNYYGIKTKRPGYTAFLGTPDTAQVNSLFAFPNIGNDPTKINLYRASGTILYHSLQGTGAWTTSGNGTISSGAHFGQAILDNVLIGGDAVGSTRWTTNGTSFTNGTLAPVAEFFEQYQNRIYADGTSSTRFYSTTNDAKNWNTSGTSDSNSFQVPGAGKLGMPIKVADKLVATKSSGIMQKWDGYSQIDMATNYGPSSPYSVAGVEGYKFFINQLGLYGFGGAMPQLLSNAIQRQFYNIQNSGIAGTAFSTIPGVTHKYDYLASVGTIVDDFTSRTVSNAIIKYDYQKNEFLNWSFANNPTAYLSYKDTSGSQQLLFGDANGQCYQMDTTTTDNGAAIPMEMVFFFTGKMPHVDKQWRWWRGFFNPGCEAKVQVACSDVFDYQSLIWTELGDCSSGFIEYHFNDPRNNRGRFLFVRIYESSRNSRTTFYGQEISFIPNPVW
jgi:hypothetical protein